MKRRWTAWLLGVLGLGAPGCGHRAADVPPSVATPPGRASDPAAPRNEVATYAGSETNAMKVDACEVTEPALNPFDPFKVRSMDHIPLPPDLRSNGRILRAANSGPVNSEAADLAVTLRDKSWSDFQIRSW